MTGSDDDWNFPAYKTNDPHVAYEESEKELIAACRDNDGLVEENNELRHTNSILMDVVDASLKLREALDAAAQHFAKSKSS